MAIDTGTRLAKVIISIPTHSNPDFSPNDGKRVFMMIEPRMINIVVTRRC